jgi:hypothetical protein
MAKVGVSLKVNLSQIDMNRIFQGQKGQYLDATVFIDLDQLDQYGNSGMITQDVKKEEKEQGVKGNILGNCKVFWSDSGQAPQQSAPQGGFNQPQQGGFNQPQGQPQGGFTPQQQSATAQQGGFNPQPQQPQGGMQQPGKY